MSDFELYWAAGFWDGEGCTMIRNGYIVLKITQKHPEVLYRFMEAVGGYGSVTGPYSPNRMYNWSCGRREEVELIINQLYPILSSLKQNQIDEMLSKAKPARQYAKKLTSDEILEIENMFYIQNKSYTEIAEKFNKSYDSICKLINARRKRLGDLNDRYGPSSHAQ